MTATATSSPLSTARRTDRRVTLEDVPQEVVDAVLTIEDRDFYDHGGVNLQATMRALVENVESGGIEQGGSTIAMQLVKNLILTPIRMPSARPRKSILAVQLEDQMSKDEILETYLDTVYFGHGAYGVQAAAEIYWQKSIGELSWPEAAFLATLIRNPVGYDPVRFPNSPSSDGRSSSMRSSVRDSSATSRPSSTAVTRSRQTPSRSFHPRGLLRRGGEEPAAARHTARRELPGTRDTVFHGGFQIYTTIDPNAQRMAEEATRPGGPECCPTQWPDQPPFTASMIAIEPSSSRRCEPWWADPVSPTSSTTSPPSTRAARRGHRSRPSCSSLLWSRATSPTTASSGGGNFANPGGEPNPYQMSGSEGTLRSVTLASSNGAYVRLGQIVGLDNVVETSPPDGTHCAAGGGDDLDAARGVRGPSHGDGGRVRTHRLRRHPPAALLRRADHEQQRRPRPRERAQPHSSRVASVGVSRHRDPPRQHHRRYRNRRPPEQSAASGREDGDDRHLLRCLVRRVLALSRHRSVGRCAQSAGADDERRRHPSHGRYLPGAHVPGVHGAVPHGAPGGRRSRPQRRDPVPRMRNDPRRSVHQARQRIGRRRRRTQRRRNASRERGSGPHHRSTRRRWRWR